MGHALRIIVRMHSLDGNHPYGSNIMNLCILPISCFTCGSDDDECDSGDGSDEDERVGGWRRGRRRGEGGRKRINELFFSPPPSPTSSWPIHLMLSVSQNLHSLACTLPSPSLPCPLLRRHERVTYGVHHANAHFSIHNPMLGGGSRSSRRDLSRREGGEGGAGAVGNVWCHSS